MIVLFDAAFILCIGTLSVLAFTALSLSAILSNSIWIFIFALLCYIGKQVFIGFRTKTVKKAIPIGIAGFLADMMKMTPILILTVCYIYLYESAGGALEGYLVIGVGALAMLIVVGIAGLCNSIAFRALEYGDYYDGEVSLIKYNLVNIAANLVPAVIFGTAAYFAIRIFLIDTLREVYILYTTSPF